MACFRKHLSSTNTGQNVLQRAAGLVVIEDLVGANRPYPELSGCSSQIPFLGSFMFREVTGAKRKERGWTEKRIQGTQGLWRRAEKE